MKRLIAWHAAALFLVVFSLSAARAEWSPAAEKEAREVAARFKWKDSKIERFFKSSRAYVVFPTVAKGGFGIGGAYGSGTVFEGGGAVGSASLTQVTIGFQFGAQAYSEIIFFKDKKTFDDFKRSGFALNAQASAVAVTTGVSADADYSGGVAVFTLAKGGLMYEASVGGQKFSFEPK